MTLKAARTSATIALAFLSLSAVVGAVPMLLHPGGEPWAMPQKLLQYSPFHSYLIPGIILLAANGLLCLWTLWLTVKNYPGYGWWVTAQGSVLLGWLIVEVVMLRMVVWAHYLYGAVAVRFLSEAVWFPSAFLRPTFAWTAIDDTSAEVSFTAFGTTVSGKLCFAQDGRLTNFVSRRFRDVRDSDPVLWSTPATAYGTMSGLSLPIAGQGLWHLESGDFTYIDLRVDEIEYDSGDSCCPVPPQPQLHSLTDS